MTTESETWECAHCGGSQREKYHEEIPEVCNECGLVVNLDIPSKIACAVNLDTEESSDQSWTETAKVTNSTEKQIALALSHLEDLADALRLPPEIRLSSAKKYAVPFRVFKSGVKPLVTA